jgi:mRNA-degrading endonuclease toxin of MazEF toxin-antitoxin module
LNRLDLSFFKHIELSEYKKSDLLAYWINDFAEYHDEERTFNIAKSGMYCRGDVIKVNLGFNIGNELGVLHYYIVLNKYDNTRNGALNVIPLTSRKDSKKYDASSVNLGKELYNVFQEKIEKEKQKLQQILDELEKIDDVPINIQNIIEKEQKYIKKMKCEISKMKKDSIALINQITTISKQRIFKDTVRRNVKISSESLDLIDKQIIKFFTK